MTCVFLFLLIHPSHRTATTAWIQTRGTLFGTAGKDSRSKAPPSSTSPSSPVRHASITSRTNRAATWYTDQVRGAANTADRCVCADVNMYVYLSFFWFFFAVSNIFEVKLNVSEPVKALKGQTLVLNCTATAELNSRANISWDYPRKVRTRLLHPLTPSTAF